MSNGTLMFASPQGIREQLGREDFCLDFHVPALLSHKSDPISHVVRDGEWKPGEREN